MNLDNDTKLRDAFPAMANTDFEIYELDIPVRAFNYLKRGNVHTLQQLLEHSPNELLWLDDSIVQQIVRGLQRYGEEKGEHQCTDYLM